MRKKRPGKKQGTLRPSKAESDAARSLGSALDEIGFLSLGHRIRVKSQNSTGTGISVPHPPTRGVQFNSLSGMVVVEFENDSKLSVPARSLEGLAQATDSEIAELELQGGTRLAWKNLDVIFEIGMLMRGKFSTNSFMALTKPVDSKGSGRLATNGGWAEPVIQFLSDNLPGSRSTGWHHDFLTAYQVGCETLVALGQADETLDGARPRANPALPAVLPRPDDVAVAVIYLAAQNGMLTFPKSDAAGRSEGAAKGHDKARLGSGRWVAHAHPEVASILRSLGMLDGNEWSSTSEAVWWRDSPVEWQIDFKNDPRFIQAVDDACVNLPDRIKVEIERIVEITDDSIALHSSTKIDGRPRTIDEVKATIRWIRRFDFDELFVKFWRIDDGWLSLDQAEFALEIFNDALAIAMRKAVAARLYPHFPQLAE